MASAHDVWKDNLRQKITKLCELLSLYLLNRQESTVKELKKQLDGTKLMFSSDRIPGPLNELQSSLNTFTSNQNHQNSFRALFHLSETLPSVVAFDEVEPPSFDSIFQSYRDDDELNKLVDELIATFKKILAEADDTLSAQICRELEAILKQLQRNRRKSLYDLLPWVDFGMRGLLVITEMQTGIKGIDWVYEGIKLSCKIKHRAIELHKEAEDRLLKEYTLTYIEKAVERFPEPAADEAAQKLLNPPGND
jgi:hypothetical protein